MAGQNCFTCNSMYTPSKADTERLSLSLAKAFDDDPLLNWMLRKDEKRNGAFRIFFKACTLMCASRGEVLVSKDLSGASLWFAPGKSKINFIRQAVHAPDMIRAAGLLGLISIMMTVEVMEAHHPKAPHYYLQIIGVDPEYQGKGVGSELMRPVLERCDQEGLGAYLENSKMKNMDFYRMHGFSVIKEIRVRKHKDSPTIWLMWRAPR